MMDRERKTLSLKVPTELALKAKDMFSDIELNMTQSVIAAIKLGLKSRTAIVRQGDQDGSSTTSNHLENER